MKQKGDSNIDSQNILDELILIIQSYLNSDTTIDNIIDLNNLLLLINNIKSLNINLKNNTINADKFLNISELEKLLLTFKNEQNKISKELILKKIATIDESDLISQKKNEYLEKGITLKNFQRCKRAVTTLAGKIIFNRMLLRPSTKSDGIKLRSLEGKKFVVPIDEFLGLDKIPFKMTIGAMLEVAKWVQRSSSYEAAEKGIKEYTEIDVNDDTMRSVANKIGSIIVKYEEQNAQNYLRSLTQEN
jgi:hypothetical protein